MNTALVIAGVGSEGGACAATVVAARSATFHPGHVDGADRTQHHSRASLTARTHRRSVAQPVAPAPTMRQGLIRTLIARAAWRRIPNMARANATAFAGYSRRGSTSAGTTTTTQRQI